jgi:hypothetical protein
MQAAEGKVREILQAGEGRESPALPRDLQHLPEKRLAQELERAPTDVALLALPQVLLMAATPDSRARGSSLGLVSG